MASAQLTATYTSPKGDTQAFATEPLPSSPQNVEEKTAYLSALRANASKLQSEINAFLTQKMDEDKLAAAEEGNGSKKSSAADDDEREEDFYGEEDPEMMGG